MPKPRTSVIWLIPREDLQNMIDTSSSIVEVLEKLGFNGYNGNHRTLTRRISVESINTEQMKLNYKEYRKARIDCTHNIHNVFVTGSKTSRKTIKKILTENNLLAYKCSECDNNGSHNGKPLILQLEHINGINDDNRLENLCFLCPNCHSQTTTFSGRNSKRPKNDKRKSYESAEKKAIRTQNMRKFNVTKEELTELIINHSMVSLGEKFGVSDTAIKKRCKRLGIDLDLRKYKKLERAMGIEPT